LSHNDPIPPAEAVSPAAHEYASAIPAAGGPSAARPVPWWHLHRRLYDWVLSWADSRYGTWALVVMSFAESSFFPVPPDTLLAPLVLGNRKKWFYYALWCSLASVVGGALGYLIGMTVWEGIDDWVFSLHIPGVNADNFAKATHWYEKYNFWIVFTAGFTPLPFKVATISAGAFFGAHAKMFLIFMLASAVSRSARFFLVAGLMGAFGPTIKPLVDKYFNLVCIVFVALLIGGFVVLKYMPH
jgi:membrane protein YqaA with SNARE-associated domain